MAKNVPHILFISFSFLNVAVNFWIRTKILSTRVAYSLSMYRHCESELMAAKQSYKEEKALGMY